MKDESQKGSADSINLSELTDFQFGPSWARGGADSARTWSEAPRERRDSSNRNERRSFTKRDERRPRRDDKFSRKAPRRNERAERPAPEPLKPVEGYRVELRPANSILTLFASEIQKQKRALPLLDMARVVMSAGNRFDIVFMKLENSPALIHSTRADGACWLTRAEAIAYLRQAPWFEEFYKEEQVEVDAPKGTFSAIAVCSMGKESIGPVNWHGYQAALMNLYRSKYSSMPLDAFKNKIILDKSEETIAAWKESATRKSVWKPQREGAGDVILEDLRAVEADFEANHFDSVYETVDKVFINGATPADVLSEGLYAHVRLLADKTRRFPQMLIPNLCHGLARHHMPIYKWHGNHFTGPSRVRTIPADMVLADRMMAIVNWSKENSGRKAEEMFAELSGVPAGADEESKAAATEAHAPYVSDMLWLLEQGFIVVTSDNAVWFPKGEAAPAPTPAPGRNKNNRNPKKRKPAKPAKENPIPAEEGAAE
ncbi:MAG: hypothetical protein IJ498_05320 [Akkermansia sp.]|nr:hypothetical protein [Akkermansia sp.]